MERINTMREWVCPYCGWKITTRIDKPEMCGNTDCGNTELKLIDKSDECEICGKKNSEDLVTHCVVPRELGGSNDEDNKIIVCSSCRIKIQYEMKRKIKECVESLKNVRSEKKENELSADTYSTLIA